MLRGSRVVGRWQLGAWYVIRDGEWDTATAEEVAVLAAVLDARAAAERERSERGRYWADRMAEIDRLGVIRSLHRTRT